MPELNTTDTETTSQGPKTMDQGQPPKAAPGYKSTEFWLSSAATVLGIALASGAVPEGGMAGQIIGGVLALLANLGYTASRTSVKTRGQTHGR